MDKTVRVVVDIPGGESKEININQELLGHKVQEGFITNKWEITQFKHLRIVRGTWEAYEAVQEKYKKRHQGRMNHFDYVYIEDTSKAWFYNFDKSERVSTGFPILINLRYLSLYDPDKHDPLDIFF